MQDKIQSLPSRIISLDCLPLTPQLRFLSNSHDIKQILFFVCLNSMMNFYVLYISKGIGQVFSIWSLIIGMVAFIVFYSLFSLVDRCFHECAFYFTFFIPFRNNKSMPIQDTLILMRKIRELQNCVNTQKA